MDRKGQTEAERKGYGIRDQIRSDVVPGHAFAAAPEFFLS